MAYISDIVYTNTGIEANARSISNHLNCNEINFH